MNTKGQVHLIEISEDNPTKVQITKMPQKGKLVRHLAGGEFRRYISMGFKPQHLYITTDEEIKEESKFITINSRTSMQGIIMTCIGINRFDEVMCKEDLHIERGWHRSNIRKVVATTNSELYIIGTKPITGNIHYSINISKIHTSFIEQYVKAYNDGTPITEVLLEVDNFNGYLNSPVTFNPEYGKLKLSSDGSVIIHPVKEKMYTRAEVKEICDKALYKFAFGHKKFDEWFKKNYPQ